MSYSLLYPDARELRTLGEPDYAPVGLPRGGEDYSGQYRPTHKPIRPRLFVGSLSEEVDEKEVRALFGKFGNLIDCYVNPAKNFAFLRMDSREGALRAQETLDGMVIHGKAMRVRRAPHNACIWVGNLPPTVSNELLMDAFAVFGEIERAIVVCDERGRSKGYGFVEFARKSSFQNAIKRCNSDYFLLTRSMKPVRVEAWEHVEEETGLEAKTLARYPGIELQLSVPPRFARSGDMEHTFAQRWRVLFEEEKKLKNELRQKMAEKRHQLEREEQSALQREGKRSTDIARRELERQERYLQEQQIRLRQQLLALGGGTGSAPIGRDLGVSHFGLSPSSSVTLGGGGEFSSYDQYEPVERIESVGNGGLLGGMRSLEGVSGVAGLGARFGAGLGTGLGIGGSSGLRAGLGTGLSLRPGEGYPRDRLAALEETYSRRGGLPDVNGASSYGDLAYATTYGGGTYGRDIEHGSWATEGGSPVGSRPTTPAPGESGLPLSTPEKIGIPFGRRGSVTGPSYEQPGLHLRRGAEIKHYTDPPTTYAHILESNSTLPPSSSRLLKTGVGGRKRPAEVTIGSTAKAGGGPGDSRRR